MTTEVKFEQTLCPYTARPLAESKEVNNEHILPVALGAPDSFYVRADAGENSRMNDLIDSPATNDPLLRFLAMAQRVVSRSGPVTVSLPASVTGTGEEVRVEFSADGVVPTFKVPVDKDPTTGEIRGVKGYGSDARKLAEQIQKNFAKKGRQLELGEVTSLGTPWLNSRLEVNPEVIRPELIKIAYLMTVRVFSDAAISSKGGALFRAAILAKTTEELKATGIKGSTFQQMPAICPKPTYRKHSLTCLRMGSDLFTAVSLFGTFNAFFSTPVERLGSEIGLGEMLEIDLATGKTRTYSDQEMVHQLTLGASRMLPIS